jgi:lipoic acid synthetase
LIYGSCFRKYLTGCKTKWLKVKLPIGKKYTELRSLVDKYSLNTICASGSCPNMGECWGEGTAMILGNTCTRSCGFVV